MSTFALTLVFIAVFMAAMAVGVVFSNRPLAGSCGGVGGPECACDAQGIPRKCEQEDAAAADAAEAHAVGPTPRDVVPTSALGRRNG